MKKSMYLIGLLLMVFSVMGQDRDQDRDRIRLEDHLLLQDNLLLQIRDQERIVLQKQLALHDGTIVNPDGTYRNSMGEQNRLRSGECLDMDGNWYKNQQQFNQNIQLRAQAMQQLHYVVSNGNVFRVQNQQRQQLREEAPLQNGGIIYPDGSYQLREQSQIRLRDGECLDPEGNHYGNEAQFRNQAQWQLKALAQEHFMYQVGKLYRYQNGIESQVREPVNYQNRLNINPDGTFMIRQRDRDRLRDGECLDLDGNVYASKQQFRDQMQFRLQAMNMEHFIVQDGNVYQVKNQEQTRLQEQARLQNGTLINPDGTFQLRNQAQARLNNGECLDMEGKRYRNEEMYQQQMRIHVQAMAEPHLLFQNGILYRSQNQVQAQVHERMQLQNGATVNPDGSYMLKGKKTQLKNGECLDMDGKRYETRDRFREKMELRVRDRMEMRDREMIERKRATESGRRIGN